MSVGEEIGVKSRRPLVASLALFLALIAGLGIWASYLPVQYGSLPFWGGAVLIGMPLYVFAEWFASIGFEMSFLAKIGRSGRIVFGVVWVLFCGSVFIVILGALSSLVQF